MLWREKEKRSENIYFCSPSEKAGREAYISQPTYRRSSFARLR